MCFNSVNEARGNLLASNGSNNCMYSCSVMFIKQGEKTEEQPNDNIPKWVELQGISIGS